MANYQPIVILILIILPFVFLLLYRNKEKKIFEKRAQAAFLAKEEQERREKIKKKEKAGITITLKQEDTNYYTLELLNSGGVALKSVELDLLLEDKENSPISSAEYEKKFPIRMLKIGERVTLSAIDYTEGPITYNVLVKWTEPNGVRVKDQIYVSI